MAKISRFKLSNARDKIEELVWSDRFEKLGPLGAAFATALRYAYGLLRDVFAGDLSLRSMSLVYTTLLSIIPLLAFSFAILKGFGVFDQLEPYLNDVLQPLGEQGDEITLQILELVDNVQGGVLGGVSMAILLWTVVSTIQKVESSFNFVWYVTKSRSLARRFTEYLIVLIVGPIVMVAALSIIGSMGSNTVVQYLSDLPGIGAVLLFAAKLIPFALVVGVFTFLYVLMPNTRVKFKSALVGGLGGGILWATMAMIFTTFVVTATRTHNMYANFAVAIFALIWLYLNWLVLLIGAQLAFYHQNPVFLPIGRQEPRLSNSMREHLALNVMMLVGRAFRNGEHICLRDISQTLSVPTVALSPISAALEEQEYLALTENEDLLPAREMARMKLQDILSVVRVAGETGSYRNPKWSPEIDQLCGELDEAMAAVVANKTLSVFLDEIDASGLGGE